MILIVVAVVQIGRLSTAMTDRQHGFFLTTQNPFWYQHECIGAYLYGAELSARGEENIYDVLDQSVAGDLLTEIYLETRRGLELASQGGARAKVKEIEMLEVEPRDLEGGPGFIARALWNVAGSVGHWGHVHTRSNRYLAELTIAVDGGQWKLSNMTVMQQERL